MIESCEKEFLRRLLNFDFELNPPFDAPPDVSSVQWLISICGYYFLTEIEQIYFKESMRHFSCHKVTQFDWKLPQVQEDFLKAIKK